MEKLSPSQIESIKKLKKKRTEDKTKRQLRLDKKKESELLGKPKYPGNAFIFYLSTLDRGEASGRVRQLIFSMFDFQITAVAVSYHLV